MTETAYGRARMYFAEMIGTFIMVFIGITAVDANLGWIAIGAAFGLGAIISIFIFGQISGAHLNPAVTVGLTLAGRFDYQDLIPYIVSQLVGAVLAALVELTIFGSVFSGAPTYLGTTVPNAAFSQPLSALIMEIFVTMFLVITVLCATREKESKNWAGLAIGLALGVGVMISGVVSGGSLNPARTFGPALVSWTWTSHWVYWVGPLLVAFFAAGIYRQLFE
ncbi:MAG TPA: aquaporin [archaeon]|nr:aquaporin [archaeon]